jgi:predicted nucleic acid-binding protein
MECLVFPIKMNDSILINAYEQLLLSTQVQLIPITQSILIQTAHLRATTNLKTADAIHAATAFSVNFTKFLTNDKGFDRGPRLPVVILSEVLAY